MAQPSLGGLARLPSGGEGRCADPGVHVDPRVQCVKGPRSVTWWPRPSQDVKPGWC